MVHTTGNWKAGYDFLARWFGWHLVQWFPPGRCLYKLAWDKWLRWMYVTATLGFYLPHLLWFDPWIIQVLISAQTKMKETTADRRE
jgi:hypothetical protein